MRSWRLPSPRPGSCTREWLKWLVGEHCCRHTRQAAGTAVPWALLSRAAWLHHAAGTPGARRPSLPDTRHIAHAPAAPCACSRANAAIQKDEVEFWALMRLPLALAKKSIYNETALKGAPPAGTLPAQRPARGASGVASLPDMLHPCPCACPSSCCRCTPQLCCPATPCRPCSRPHGLELHRVHGD
jgi:hypothetical protein